MRNLQSDGKNGDENRAMSTSKHLDISSIGDAQICGSRTQKSQDSTKFTLKDKIPFRWRYGRITSLSEEEKAEVNQPRGRRQQYKNCCICGCNGGTLAYRKESDGNSCLICEDCAISYVLSAIKLQQKWRKIGDD